MTSFPPGLLLLIGALVALAIPGKARKAWLLILPVVSLLAMFEFGHGEHARIEAFGYSLTLMRVDALSLVFGTIFHVAAFLGVLYTLYVKDRMQTTGGLVYAGSAIGAVFAGDMITLFLFWEVVAASSTLQILARRTRQASNAAFRYLMVQLISGLLLLVGMAFLPREGGSIPFGAMTLSDPGTIFVFLAFGLKCGWPLLHGWIVDGYPAASPGGSVLLSAFTTKLAVYALARGFAGTECLIWIGGVMAVFPVFYAVIENDLRRVLCYSMINQIGYMVCGVGIGTELALNGVAAHAFCHILYKALLFMSLGAVLYRTGRTEATELGGLYRTMPWTAAFCMVGAASISALPLTNGFISKSMIMSAVAAEGHDVVWLMLLFAAAAVFYKAGIKVPFRVFFARDSGMRPKEAPLPMLLAMGAAALLCIGLGVFPQLLYAHLPSAVAYAPYTLTHVVTHLQLLVLSALLFAVLYRRGLYPPELRAVNLDADCFHRRGGPALYRLLDRGLVPLLAAISAFFHERLPRALAAFTRNPPGAMKLGFDRMRLAAQGLVGRGERIDEAWEALERDRERFRQQPATEAWPIGATVLYMTLAFAVYLVLYLLG